MHSDTDRVNATYLKLLSKQNPFNLIRSIFVSPPRTKILGARLFVLTSLQRVTQGQLFPTHVVGGNVESILLTPCTCSLVLAKNEKVWQLKCW